MNYAEQELLRQQKALAVLLLGRTAENAGQAETIEREAGWSAAFPEETPETAVFKTEESGGAAVLPTGGAGNRRSYSQIRRETVPVVPGAASRQRSGVTAQGGQAERTVTEFFRADVRETPDAETLSRTFQRDARRYDGGFTLY